MNVNDFIDRNTAKSFFILDSHDKGVHGQRGNTYADEDFSKYSYSPSINNKLSVGSVFLYRKPGKGKLFQIIGGGQIDSISAPDSSGLSYASIINGFKLIQPIRQGDPFLESFKWKNKKKPMNGWKGFWTNYGILRIESEDFWGLLSNSKCIPGISATDSELENRADEELILEIDAEDMSAGSTAPVINNSAISAPPKNNQTRQAYKRDRKVADNALKNAGHQCEYNNRHVSFIRRGKNYKYCEPHHLVPMKYQVSFSNSLDREENIVSLCSNCHNQIHYGEGAAEMVKALYEMRSSALKRVGIEIDLETLLALYEL